MSAAPRGEQELPQEVQDALDLLDHARLNQSGGDYAAARESLVVTIRRLLPRESPANPYPRSVNLHEHLVKEYAKSLPEELGTKRRDMIGAFSGLLDTYGGHSYREGRRDGVSVSGRESPAPSEEATARLVAMAQAVPMLRSADVLAALGVSDG